MHVVVSLWSALCAFGGAARRRLASEVGEGVISTVIAILIVAVLGVAVWGGAQTLMQRAQQQAENQIQQIQ